MMTLKTPNSAERLLSEGVAAQKAGNFPLAEFKYQSVLRDHPKDHRALNLMGTLALEAKKADIAVGYFQKALKGDPKNTSYLFNLGSAYHAHQKPHLAVDHLRKVVARNPRSTRAWRRFGQALAALGKHEEALQSFDRLMELQPDDHTVAVDRAEILVNLGRMDEAAAIFRKAAHAGQEEARALIGLSVAQKFTPGDDAPLQMVDCAERTEKASIKVGLRYAAGKALADQKQHDAAFEQFSLGKSEAGNSFPIAEHRAAYERIKEAFPKALVEELAEFGSPSEKPVFIVGMPRSGTTLTEQILASHPSVFGAGELTEFHRIAASLGRGDFDRTRFARTIRELDRSTIRRLAKDYLTAIERRSGNAQRVVDKMPHNYELLGLISIIFPKARIIHCRRDAMDTCVSCFTQNFSDAHGYNDDLTVLGQYYRAYDDLMRYWGEVLPGRIHLSEYEVLTSDQEAASRRLIDWIGLEWDDRCLSFEKTERLVATPSRWQVRQPIYKTSVEKWRRYEKHLGPLRKALGPLAS